MKEVKFDEKTARMITSGAVFGKVKTMLGLNARIVCWNAKGDFPIVALIELADGSEKSRQYTLDGKIDVRPNVRTNFDLTLLIEGGEA